MSLQGTIYVETTVLITGSGVLGSPYKTINEAYNLIRTSWSDTDFGVIHFVTSQAAILDNNTDTMIYSVKRHDVAGAFVQISHSTSVSISITQTVTLNNAISDGASNGVYIIGIQTNTDLTSSFDPGYLQYTGYIGNVSRVLAARYGDINSSILTTNFSGGPFSDLEFQISLDNFDSSTRTGSDFLNVEQLDGTNGPSGSASFGSVLYTPSGGTSTWNFNYNQNITSSFAEGLQLQLRFIGAGAGGDPHIKTNKGDHYMIPNDWYKFNLLTAKKDNYNLKIEATTKNLSQEQLSNMHKYNKKGQGRIRQINTNKEGYYLDYTFFDKLYIEFNNEKLTIDCSTLQAKGDYNKFDHIKMHRECPSQGIYSFVHNKYYPRTKSTKQRNIVCGDIMICVKSDQYWDEYNDISLLFNSNSFNSVSGAIINESCANLIDKF
jgi:hypothetical protein